MLERAHAVLGALPDGPFGYGVTETDVQGRPPTVLRSIIIITANKCKLLALTNRQGSESAGETYLRMIDEHNENYYRLVIVDKTKLGVTSPPAPPKVKSESLLGKARTLVITHNGRDYCLRVTQNGKLILTA